MAKLNLEIIILAAGVGSRMHSNVPKVLHKIAGMPLLQHVIQVAQQLNPNKIHVVYSPKLPQVKEQLSFLGVNWVEQDQQLGTGHAVQQALPHLAQDSAVLILYGDMPLILPSTLAPLINLAEKDQTQISWLTAMLETEDPTGFGRIVRSANGRPKAIIEEKDATEEEKSICEINTGICLIPAEYLHAWLPQLKNNNAQQEYYLTDLFSLAIKQRVKLNVEVTFSEEEILGVNDCFQLGKVERYFQYRQASKLLCNGLTLLDPNRFDLRGELTFGKDVIIDVNVVLEGKITIGANCYIGTNVYLRDVVIGDNVTIKSNSFIEAATIGDSCEIGPFARVRAGTKLLSHAKLGNFVEVKQTTLGAHSKVNHLSYVGDTTVGDHVNIGAGTITCNYDGVNKYPTIIEDDAFIGSNTSLVAPVTIGKGATVGAGSVITENVPAHKLAVARSKQTVVEGWQRKKK